MATLVRFPPRYTPFRVLPPEEFQALDRQEMIHYLREAVAARQVLQEQMEAGLSRILDAAEE